jgi:hypothetical protein
MKRIDRIENLLEVWQANEARCLKSGKVKAADYSEGVVDGIKLALSYFKEPSNTRMQSDGLIAHCQKCKEKVKDWPKYKRDCMGNVGHR